ncbi:hypothetical protein I3U41_05900 [Mycobacteroides abscessus subsp. abscessus]|uniref:hypothetical protein n=1 Tax=Mycobacteroides abscessus TaxID=36809 RepID=UPI0019D2CD52|nr:hypothetical protein [Mycobacteroides abscessus]QSN22141.1 hypothetical protein I3U41_05900 [Mycobacteroides abscessus subsp. abscessus]
MYTPKQNEAFQEAYARAAERRVALDAEFMCIEATDWVNRPTAHVEFMHAMDEHRKMREQSDAQLQFELEVAQGKWDNLLGERP